MKEPGNDILKDDEVIYAKILDTNGKYLIHVTQHKFDFACIFPKDDKLTENKLDESNEVQDNFKPYSIQDGSVIVISSLVPSTTEENNQEIKNVASVNYNFRKKKFEIKIVMENHTVKINDDELSYGHPEKKLMHQDCIRILSSQFYFIHANYAPLTKGNSRKQEDIGIRLRSSTMKEEKSGAQKELEEEEYDSEMEDFINGIYYIDDSESNIMEGGGIIRKSKQTDVSFLISHQNRHHKASLNPTYQVSSNEYPTSNFTSDSKSKQKRRVVTDDEIKRDEQGKPILPLTFGGITLINLGEIVWDKDKFHSKRYIFPVGYCSKRSYFSLKDPSTRCMYIQEILENKNPTPNSKNSHVESEPLFRLTCEDLPDEPIEGPTPSGVWAEVLERVRPVREEITGKKLFTNVSGPEQFGLSHKIIHKLIYELPNSTKCTKYDPTLAENPNTPVSKGSKKRKREIDFDDDS